MHCSWAAVASGTSHGARLAAPAPQHASAYQNALWRAARNWRSTGRVISYRQLWSILRIEWEVKKSAPALGNPVRNNESTYKSGWWFEIFHVSFHRTWGWWPISGGLKSQSKHGFVRLLSSRVGFLHGMTLPKIRRGRRPKLLVSLLQNTSNRIADKKSALSRFDPVVDSRLVSRCLPPIPLKKQDFNRLPVYHLFAMVFYPCCMYLHPKLICLCICASSEESWTEWPMTHLPIWVNTKHSKLGLAFHIPTSWCRGTFCWFVPAERSKLTHAQPWWASLGIPWCTPWRRWTPVCLTMFDP